MEARGIRSLLLVGLVIPPTRSIWVLPPYVGDPELYRHEMVHIEQIERHGWLKFTALYAYYLVRYGYRNNPFEVEAYSRENVHG